MNTQARDAKSLGSLRPGPELLPQLLRQPLGGTPLLVRSGGTTSRCAADQHWTLDLRRHQQFRYLSATQEVEFGTGLTMGDLLRQLQAFNRAIPIGLSGLPGSGFVLTGGMGPLSRTQGLAIDHISQIEGVWGSGAPFTLDVEQARRSQPRRRVSRPAGCGALSSQWSPNCGCAPIPSSSCGCAGVGSTHRSYQPSLPWRNSGLRAAACNGPGARGWRSTPWTAVHCQPPAQAFRHWIPF